MAAWCCHQHLVMKQRGRNYRELKWILKPELETVLAPMRLPGNYSYSIQTHASPLDPIPLEDEVWEKKVAAFWMTDDSERTIKPIGLALVASGSLLTNKHVLNAIEAARASRKNIFISAVKREVKSTIGMIKFEPTDHYGPSDKNEVAFPVSSDFVLLPLPKDFSLLSIRSGGSTQFGGNTSRAVLGGFYKSDGNCWRFYLSPGITSPSNLVLGGVSYPGVSTWSGYSTFGASGCPLFAMNGEFLGLNVGVVSSGDGLDKTAIFVRASAILGYYLAKSENRNHFKGNRFGLLDYVRDRHSTTDSQRDLDPTWYDDYAEELAEEYRRSAGEGDEAVGEWAWDEEGKKDDGQKTSKWFGQNKGGQQDEGSDDEPAPRGGRNRDRRDHDDDDDHEENYQGRGRYGGGRGGDKSGALDYSTSRHDGAELEATGIQDSANSVTKTELKKGDEQKPLTNYIGLPLPGCASPWIVIGTSLDVTSSLPSSFTPST